jgi:hypothetical protein
MTYSDRPPIALPGCATEALADPLAVLAGACWLLRLVRKDGRAAAFLATTTAATHYTTAAVHYAAAIRCAAAIECATTV